MVSSKQTKSAEMRLDAYLARSGLASRRGARDLIRRGAVYVDAEVCRDAAHRIGRESVVVVAGRTLDSPAAVQHFVLHKPVGFSCSRDDRESPLVSDLLSETLRRRSLLIAGRLDRATSGLLVLTQDGGFVHQLTHPTRKTSKRYRIGFEGDLVEDAVACCRAGFLLGGEERPTRPAELVLDGPGRATLVLREGRTHQVRRMIRKLGGEVISLHRDRIGSLGLPDDLGPGDCRPLAREERALLLRESSL